MNKPKPYGLNELREMYLRFFETKGHLRLPSFPLIPQNDASVLLVVAGMQPLKPWFTGEQEPPRSRVTTCQKCIRTEDLENIGKTDRHGTYFEMLGNFSFGDYFKRDAIHWAWEFLTSPDWVGIDPELLYPSVYEEDEEAFAIWRDEIGIAPERIFKFGKADNFWEHGSGPCGPCSEIYYDRGEKYGCGKPTCTVGCDCDRYIEVWNIVFSQFNNDGEGHYTELKQKNIDTGMGLERLACVMQDVGSLFDVDTVINITNKVSEYTGVKYHEDAKSDVSLRIITDHIRASVMMISDGVLPSNEGRGYVLRRLLRRAARHSRLLGVHHPYLYEVVSTVIHENEGAYPELRSKQAYIEKIVRMEEENFARTIDSGLGILNGLAEEHLAKGEKTFSGADAFKLYDTYGFPVELTEEIVGEKGLTVDEEGFRKLMEEQRVRARKAREALGDLGWAGIEFGKEVPETEFVGYEHNVVKDAKIVALVVENEQAEEIMPGVEAIMVLDKTPFYAEMGGQTADHGVIGTELIDKLFQVTDVQKNKGGKYMHYGKVLKGSFKLGDTVSASIDLPRRQAIRRAHSATHLLNAALREVLGDHVHQAGSLVEPDRLRFDFTHFSAMTGDELLRVARIVNEEILQGDAVTVQELPIEEARKLGAQALFGEKYGETVRVVTMGDSFSVEFCGGTHVDNTAKVGPFRISSEASIASGVRRIEAVTGLVFFEENERRNRLLLEAAESLKTSPAGLVDKIRENVGQMKELSRVVETLRSRIRAGEIGNFLASAKDVEGFRVVTTSFKDAAPEELRKMGDALRDKDPCVIAVLAGVDEDKITFQAVCGKEAVEAGIKAGDIIRQVTAICGGKGGGRPDSAMGGGKDVLMLDNALAMVDNYVAMKLKEKEN